ncbi:MAG: family 43 glycosylhydrolase [Pseudobdellovibrionaceae bacterium]|nr:family 43 glycosylhydrolase [Pseudobdellovibrionaceae bacterium]
MDSKLLPDFRFDEARFRNPIIETGADPWIIKKDELYYYCFSDNKSSIYVSYASSPERLDQAKKHCIWRAPKGRAYSHETWAPELHFLDGRWYVYFAASDGNNHTHRMYVLEADRPTGPYRFKGQITPNTDRWAIDGTVLDMPDGARYFVWSGWDGQSNIQQNLYIARMVNPWTLVQQTVANPKLKPVRRHAGAFLNLEAHADEAGVYSLEVLYSCTHTSMQRLTINGESHLGLHYTPTGSGNWQTHYEKIELHQGRNILRFAEGIGKAKIDKVLIRPLGQDRSVISSPEFHWEKMGGPPYINEGPQILWRNDRLHIVYSASGSWTDHYQLGLLTFQGGDIMDKKNWKKKGPVFQGTDQVFGPGHASFIQFEERDFIVYHSAKYSGAGWNRHVRMQPFSWDDEGDPVFGSPWAPEDDDSDLIWSGA